MKTRNKVLSVLGIIVLLALFLFRVTAGQVVLTPMKSFQDPQPDGEVIFRGRYEVAIFTYAMRFAIKRPGIVDIAAPPYKVTIGGNSYYLWLRQDADFVEMMKGTNSHHLYKVNAYFGRKLKEIIFQ